MKKKFTLVAFATMFACGSMFAQSLKFVEIKKVDEAGKVVESVDLENGAEITRNEGHYLDFSETDVPKWVLSSIESDLGLKNLTSNSFTVVVAQEVVEAPTTATLSLCWGNCTMENGNISKEHQIPASSAGIMCENNGGFHLNLSLMGVTEYQTAKVIYKAYDKANPSEAVTVTVNYEYNEQTTGISSATANQAVTVYQSGNIAELAYNFDSAATRQLNIYNVTGKLIASEMLVGANGTQTLSVQKGLYIYSLTENGKVVATHKFVVR